MQEEIFKKLEILTDAAKYDVSCSSSGSERANTAGGLGNAARFGICHSFSGDGRCISLLKILMSNACIYDCQYCVNRRSNDIRRAQLEPREIADLTVNFYKRNYIEGLFLSSGVIRDPDYTMERMIECIRILRNEYRFNGYIHAKTIPGASAPLINAMGLLVDRISVNIEMPSSTSLAQFAPQKTKQAIVAPMRRISDGIHAAAHEMQIYRHAPQFAPAGQSTQMIIGATPETDYKILTLSENLYNRFNLKRVYYSAYIPVGTNPLLPVTKPPLLREHRLYQADWLLRYYGFTASELLDEQHQDFNAAIDPKCDWALRHKELFPVEINTAPYEMLLRVPGIGVCSAAKIAKARRYAHLRFEDLKKMRIPMKRTKYFITCGGKTYNNIWLRQELITAPLLADTRGYGQISLFDEPTKEDNIKCLTGEI